MNASDYTGSRTTVKSTGFKGVIMGVRQAYSIHGVRGMVFEVLCDNGVTMQYRPDEIIIEQSQVDSNSK